MAMTCRIQSPAPEWQRLAARVRFEPWENQKLTFSIRGHAVDWVNDAKEDDEGTD
jgi:hypothetical protein